MPTPDEPRHRPGVAREYRAGRIVVYWEPQFCIHTASCLNAQPDVFNSMRRPWIVLDGADPDDVAAAVLTCPTGALSFERLDGGAQEPVPEETTIEPRPNGPLYLRGRVRIGDARGTDARGNVTRDAARVALCRCGGSDNKPYCDGTHRVNGFRAS